MALFLYSWQCCGVNVKRDSHMLAIGQCGGNGNDDDDDDFHRNKRKYQHDGHKDNGTWYKPQNTSEDRKNKKHKKGPRTEPPWERMFNDEHEPGVTPKHKAEAAKNGVKPKAMPLKWNEWKELQKWQMSQIIRNQAKNQNEVMKELTAIHKMIADLPKQCQLQTVQNSPSGMPPAHFTNMPMMHAPQLPVPVMMPPPPFQMPLTQQARQTPMQPHTINGTILQPPGLDFLRPPELPIPPNQRESSPGSTRTIAPQALHPKRGAATRPPIQQPKADATVIPKVVYSKTRIPKIEHQAGPNDSADDENLHLKRKRQ